MFYLSSTSSDPMKPTAQAQQITEGGTEDPAEQQQERTYGYAKTNAGLEFDPTKDLNLPGSYDEVVSRFKKLQGTRSMETLN